MIKYFVFFLHCLTILSCKELEPKVPFVLLETTGKSYLYKGIKTTISLIDNVNNSMSTTDFIIESADSDSNGKIRTVKDEGLWQILNDSSGLLVFTPQKSFKNAPSAIKYTIRYSDGSLSNYSSIQLILGPVANPESISSTNPNQIYSFSFLDNDVLSNGEAIANGNYEISLDTNGIQTHEKILENGDKWKFDPSSKKIFFIPNSKFTKSPKPLIYLLKDLKFGFSDTSIVVLNYVPFTKDDKLNSSNESFPLINDDSGTDLDPKTLQILRADLGSDGLIKTISEVGQWKVNLTNSSISFHPIRATFKYLKIPEIEYTVADTYGNISKPTKISNETSLIHYLDLNGNLDSKGTFDYSDMLQDTKIEGEVRYSKDKFNKNVAALISEKLNISLPINNGGYDSPLGTPSGFTISVEFYLNQTSQQRQQILRTSPSPISHIRVIPSENKLDFSFLLLGSKGSFEESFEFNGNYIGKWIHLVYTIQEGSIAKIYLNGKLVKTFLNFEDGQRRLFVTDFGTGVSYTQKTDGSISTANFYDLFSGRFDNLMSFKSVLSEADILELYNFLNTP